MPSLLSVEELRQGARLRSLLRGRRPQVFHAHDMYGNLFGVPWACMAGVPMVLASRRWWKKELRPGHEFANRIAYRLAHAVVANSPRVAEEARKCAGGGTTVAVIPNYVDEAAFHDLDPEVRQALQDELGIPPGRSIIGCVANLRSVKDHETLLKAVSLVIKGGHDVHLVLVGDGELRQDLTRLRAELDVENRVSFAGQRPHHPNLHHLFDISTFASTDEAFPNSLLEGMAAGNPVVATRVGGIPDAVVDGQTGLLIPPEDPGSFAIALIRLLSAPEPARRMGEEGRRKRVRQRFSAKAALTELTELYADRLDRTEPARGGGRGTDSTPASMFTEKVSSP